MQLYKEMLDRLNISYVVTKIKQLRFEELNFLVSLAISKSAILPTMIFIDHIEMIGEIAIYL